MGSRLDAVPLHTFHDTAIFAGSRPATCSVKSASRLVAVGYWCQDRWLGPFSPTHRLTARGPTDRPASLDRASHPRRFDGRDAGPLTSIRASIHPQQARLEYLNTAGAAPEPFLVWSDLAATPSARPSNPGVNQRMCPPPPPPRRENLFAGVVDRELCKPWR
jgi:hypothetical protein